MSSDFGKKSVRFSMNKKDKPIENATTENKEISEQNNNESKTKENLETKLRKTFFIVNSKVPRFETLSELSKLIPNQIRKEELRGFTERKVELEKHALLEEKTRAELEKKGKFTEKEFEFNGEDPNLLVPNFNKMENQSEFIYKNTRLQSKSVFLRGYANLSLDIKAYFEIPTENKPVHDELYTYIKPKSRHSQPYLNKLMKNKKLRKVTPVPENLYSVSANTLLTIADINKRAEIYAKLFLKYNLEEAIEKTNIIEEEEQRLRDEQEKLRKEKEEKEKMEKEKKEREQREQEERKKLEAHKVVDEPIIKDPKVIELSNYTRLFNYQDINDEKLKEKYQHLHKYFKEIINYIDQQIFECFNKDKFQECLMFKRKKEVDL